MFAVFIFVGLLGDWQNDIVAKIAGWNGWPIGASFTFFTLFGPSDDIDCILINAVNWKNDQVAGEPCTSSLNEYNWLHGLFVPIEVNLKKNKIKCREVN